MLLIDAANVIGSRPSGWWRDRPAAARDLVERVVQAVASNRLDDRVVLVLEGQARAGWDEGLATGLRVVHALGSGDDALVEIAAESEEPVVAVTADRALRSRLQELGAQVVGPQWLLRRLGGAPSGGLGN